MIKKRKRIMSMNHYLNNLFPIKKEKVSESIYKISDYFINKDNIIVNVIFEKLDYFSNDIINIIKDYFLIPKHKLLEITNKNINLITKIDDDITSIICVNLGLETLPEYIYTAKNLISLDCSFNNIKKLPNEKIFENLLMLNCGFNKLKNLPKNMNNLRKLYVSYNKLNHINSLLNVYTIVCINNNIEYIDKDKFPKLKIFYSYWNSNNLDEISKTINKINRDNSIETRSKRRRIS